MKALLRAKGVFATDIGPRRATNQDRAAVAPEAGLFVLADGMGGHDDGHRAAELAVETITSLLRELPQRAGSLREAFRRAHERIQAEAENGGKQMGTTLTTLLVENGLMVAAHVGDSRLYRLREGTLVQLTRDHSFVQMLMDAGQLSQAEAKTHPKKHVLVKAIGGRSDSEPDLIQDEVHQGDRYLLCSDGLSNVVTPEDIAGVLSAEPDSDQAAQNLVEMALRNGTTDNVTVVIVDIDGGE